MRNSCVVRKEFRILLRDAHGRIQGSYQDGKFDKKPVAGKDLTLSIDVNLQALAERMLQGKIGSVVAIEPSTGEVLALVSSPTYDPRALVGRMRSKTHRALSRNVWKPLSEPCHHGTVSSRFNIQDNPGTYISNRRYHHTVDNVPV